MNMEWKTKKNVILLQGAGEVAPGQKNLFFSRFARFGKDSRNIRSLLGRALMIERPRCLDAADLGLLQGNAEKTLAALRCCLLCLRRCGVDRLSGEMGERRGGKLRSAFWRGRASVRNVRLREHFLFRRQPAVQFLPENFDVSYGTAGEMVSASRQGKMMLSLQEGSELDRTTTRQEYEESLKAARKAGLHRFDRPRRYALF
jgi:hypothetical protein